VIKYKDLKGAFKDENNVLNSTDTDVWKRRSWIGFDTLVVYAIKDGFWIRLSKLTFKYPTWIVQPQGSNLTKLAGIFSNGGTCGLMR